MMFSAALLGLVAHVSGFAGKTVDTPRLEYYPGRFVAQVGNKEWSSPIAEAVPPPTHLSAFRRDDDYAVWDERGLTIRHRGKTRSLRLEDFPLSPGFFSREEIRRTIDLVSHGGRSKAADALSGAVRIGPNAYFLVRWDGQDGKPWAEALVRVALNKPSLWPEVLGRFSGLSTAYKSVDDRLFVLGGLVSCVVREADHWGLSTFDPSKSVADSDRFRFRLLGATLLAYMATGKRTATFVERTAYGATLAGRVDLGSAFRRTLVEGRDTMRFLDPSSPSIVLASTTALLRVFDGETGAELRLSHDCAVGRAGPYVVAWRPADKPESATLYEPERWTPIAAWHTGLPRPSLEGRGPG